MKYLADWLVLLVTPALKERERWGLWAPVGIGLGVWAYFALPAEPGPGWLLLTPALLALFALWRWAMIVPLLLALGFTAGQVAVWRAGTPLLQQARYAPEMQGRVVALDPAVGGATLQLDRLEIAGMDAAGMQVRVKYTAAPEAWPAVGSRVALGAMLMPLSEPAAPGAFDFRRAGFFNGVSAQGFVRGGLRVMAPPEAGRSDTMLWVERLRGTISLRVQAELAGDTAQIAAALLNGAQSGISARVKDEMRAAGLFHILSISGLHLAIVAAFVYGGVRRGLALSQRLALYWPIKKIAAVCALVFLPFYTLLVGEPVPAVRSALMAGLILLAIVAERRALSLRTVALAAGALLLVVPQSLLGASFQLSFAAVTVMIAGYETLRRVRQPVLKREETGWGRAALRRMGKFGGGMLLTSLLAGLATAPVTMFQFQQANWYGIIANMLGIPLTSFVIMPAGFIACLLMPFGAEAWALQAMGWGIDRLIGLAALVAGWPGATLWIKAFPAYAFAPMVLGGLWLCLWQGWWRLGGLLPLALGAGLAWFAPRPDIYVAAEFANWAAKGPGTVWLAQKAGRDFTIRQWRQREGEADFVGQKQWPQNGPVRCDALGCVYETRGKKLAVVKDAAALAEDCGGVDVIITPLWRAACAGVPVVDGARLKLQGATVVRFEETGVVLESARKRWGGRPWSPGWRAAPPQTPLISEAVVPPAAQAIAPEIDEQEEGEGE